MTAIPNHSINYFAPLAPGAPCSVGQVMIPDEDTGDFYVVATSAARNGRGSEGVAISAWGGVEGSVGQVKLAQNGILPAEQSGLSVVASRKLVRCSSTGSIERIDNYTAGDDVIGYAEADGRVHLHFGLPWTDIDGLVTIPIEVGSGTFPTTGELARFGSSIGSGAVTAPLLTWKRSSAAGDINLITVRDVSSTFASVTYGGPSGTDSQTQLTGQTVAVTATAEVILTGANADTGSGPGGTLIVGNWALGYLAGTTDFQGGRPIGYIGNTATLPTGPPSTGFFLMCNALRTRFEYETGEKLIFGGSNDITLSGSTRNYTASLKSASPNNYMTRWEWRGRSGRTRFGYFYNEESVTSGALQAVARYDMADETTCAFTYRCVVCRSTNATKNARYEGKVQYYRTGAAGPTAFGTASEEVQETTAGDAFSVAVSSNEIQFLVDPADTDARLVSIEVWVQEVTAT